MNKEALVERYFSGQISQEDFLLLETLLENDGEFKKDFHAQLEVRQTIANEKNASLKKRLDRLENKAAPKTRWYPYAAAIIVLIGLGFFFFNARPDHQELYAEYFEAYPNVVAPTVRGNTDLEADEMALAFRHYD